VINILKEKTLDAQSIVKKFNIGRGNLDMMLSSQKCSLNKTGLGYKHDVSKPKSFQKNFSPYHMNRPKNSKVFYAYKYAYNTSYSYRNNTYKKPKSKWIWVPKANPIEPENKKGSNVIFPNSYVGFKEKQVDFGQRMFQAYDWKGRSILFNSK
jgi:hypothetical protein